MVNLAEFALVCLLGAFFAFGFLSLHLASPTAKLPFKPFSCKTCMMGWGALLFHSWYWYLVSGINGWHFKENLIVLVALHVSLGGAKLLQRLAIKPPPSDELPPIAS